MKALKIIDLSGKLFCFLLFLVIIDISIDGIINEGSWVLNQQIALGDRFLNDGIRYSSGIDDLFIPSSPYFPGVGFLSSFLQILLKNNFYLLNQLMIIISISLGCIYFFILKILTKKFFPQIPKLFSLRNKNVFAIVVAI